MSDNTNPYSNVISPGEADSQVDAATLDGASLSTDGTLSGNSDTLVSTQKAVKTYVDNATEDYDDAFSIDGSDNVTTAADLTTTGDLNCGVDLDVSGDAVIDGDLTMGSGSLDITGSAAISSTLTAETLTLSIADGTTPMTITSTTKVSNLNVDQVDGCDVEDSDSLGTSDVKIPTQGNVKAYVDSSANPIGSIIAFDLSMPSVPAISSSYEECNGQQISDGDSPFDGYRLRNLNGANVALTLTWTADAGGAYATVAATDVTALAEGDDVLGGAIAAGSTITDITGTTVTISDVAIDTEVESTFTNDGRFLRGSATSGTGQKDALQGHAHGMTYEVNVTGPGGGYNFGGSGNTYTSDSIESDGANGTPRTDTETRPINLEVVYYQKIK